ncbi:MAG: tetratricopeptide repeat protein [Nitrospina sp.]|jgi:tetratricopeptide (TPR) repeat protein|nr:tetratricopeptide repeat protein [Nitrospina sp.]
MTKTKFVALLVAILGSLLYFYSTLNPTDTWESHNKKGLSAFKESRHAVAEKHFVQALELAEAFPPNDPRLYFILYQLAEIYRIQSKLPEAEQVLRRILEMDEKKFGPEHPNIALGLNNLAGNSRLRGKYEEAEALLKRALKILEKSLGGEHPLVGNILEHYAHLLHKMDRSAEAKKLERRFNTIYSRLTAENQ